LMIIYVSSIILIIELEIVHIVHDLC
jgi:hypothetical protein